MRTLNFARRVALGAGMLASLALVPDARAAAPAVPAGAGVTQPALELRATESASAANGAWSLIPPPSARYGQSAVYDMIHDRMIVFGGSDNFLRNDVWIYSFSTMSWTRLKPAGFAPSERYRHSAVYDLARDRVVVFGGVDEGTDRNDVWALSLAGTPAWSQLATFGEPPPLRREHTAVYDAGRDRMIVMGGFHSGAALSDVWSLSLGGLPVWTRLSPTGSGPGALYRHSAIYDPRRRTMVVFGGNDGTTLRSETWTLSLEGAETWSSRAVSGPPARGEHTAIYDAPGDRMVVYGGFDGTGPLGDVWALAPAGTSGWTQLSPGGTAPSPRYRHSAIYDPIRKQMLVFGGLDPFKNSDLYSLSLIGTTNWRGMALLGTSPSPRSEHAAVYDPVRDRMIIFGGHKSPALLDETWALALAGTPRWGKLAIPAPPHARIGHSLIYDPRHDRVILWGGVDDTGAYYDDAWQLDLSGTPAWTKLVTAGPAPPARAWHSAIDDPARQRMIVWGGMGADASFNETWSLSLDASPTWSLIAQESRPPLARTNHCAVYDPVRDRMLVLGGNQFGQQAGAYFDDIWSLGLATNTWTNVAYSGSPPGLLSATYDPVRDRVVALNASAEYRSIALGAWELALTGPPLWTALVPSGQSPSIRERSAIYDPIRDRALVFGGDEGHFLTGDTWVLSWNQPARPSVACSQALFRAGGDSVDARFVISNPLAGDRAIAWKLTDSRGWPGLPVQGTLQLAGGASETLQVLISIPPATVPVNRLQLTACYCGAEGNAASCERDIADVTTGTLASLVSAEAEPGRVRLAWRTEAGGPVTIARRGPDTGWQPLTEVAPDRGRVTYEDRGVASGTRYGYRLEWNEGARRVIAGEAWIDVPSGLELALIGVRPNPVMESGAIAFTLPERGRVVLELFDVNGRRAGAKQEIERAAGYHVVPLTAAGACAPGVYLVRLTFGARTLQTRVVIAR